MCPQNGFFLKMPVRLAPWPRKESEWHASPLPQSQARSERERERERETEREGEIDRERERERTRARDRYRERERERETGANPPQRAFPKNENKPYTKMFSGS